MLALGTAATDDSGEPMGASASQLPPNTSIIGRDAERGSPLCTVQVASQPSDQSGSSRKKDQDAFVGAIPRQEVMFHEHLSSGFER